MCVTLYMYTCTSVYHANVHVFYAHPFNQNGPSVLIEKYIPTDTRCVIVTQINMSERLRVLIAE